MLWHVSDPDDASIKEMNANDSRSTPVTRDEIRFQTESPLPLDSGVPIHTLLQDRNNIPVNNNVHVSNNVPVSNVVFPPNQVSHGVLVNGYSSNQPGYSEQRTNGYVQHDAEPTVPQHSEPYTRRASFKMSGDNVGENMVIFEDNRRKTSDDSLRVFNVVNETSKVKFIDHDINEFINAEMALPMTSYSVMETVSNESSRESETLPYPSYPRERSNLMPPIETIGPEIDREH